MSSNSKSLPDNFHTQNQYLQELMDNYSTSNTKTVYLNDQMQSLIDINWWLFWIFIFVAIVFSIFIFINPKIKVGSGIWSILFKIFIVIIVVLYPFYIYTTEKYLMIGFTYIKEMIMGNPYVAPDF